MKRFLALLLCVLMLTAMLPLSVLAEEAAEEPETVTEAPAEPVPEPEPVAEEPAEEPTPEPEVAEEPSVPEQPTEPAEQPEVSAEDPAPEEPSEPESQDPTPDALPWEELDDGAFIAYIYAPENAAYLAAVLADTGSEAYAAFTARVEAIADEEARAAVKEYLLTLAPASEEEPLSGEEPEETTAEPIENEPEPEDPAEPEPYLTVSAVHNATVKDGSAAFTASAYGTAGSFSYQWQQLDDSAEYESALARREAWEDIPGATEATLTISGLDAEVFAAYENMLYRCIVRAEDDAEISDEAKLLPDPAWAEEAEELPREEPEELPEEDQSEDLPAEEPEEVDGEKNLLNEDDETPEEEDSSKQLLWTDADILGPVCLVGCRDFAWPCPNARSLSSCYYNWDYGVHASQGGHKALDLCGAALDSDVVAAYAGVVKIAQTGYNGGMGSNILVEHQYRDNSGNTVTISTRYCHLHSINVSVGQSVTKGQRIGGVGGNPAIDGDNAGGSSGLHLDFKVIKDGQCIDPFSNNLLSLNDLNQLQNVGFSCCTRYLQLVRNIYSTSQNITVRSSIVHNYTVSIPANYILYNYTSATSMVNYTSDRVEAMSSPYVITCTAKYTLSNGKVRYRWTSGGSTSRTLYFEYDSSRMSVTENHNYVNGVCSCGAEDPNYNQGYGSIWAPDSNISMKVNESKTILLRYSGYFPNGIRFSCAFFDDTGGNISVEWGRWGTDGVSDYRYITLTANDSCEGRIRFYLCDDSEEVYDQVAISVSATVRGYGSVWTNISIFDIGQYGNYANDAIKIYFDAYSPAGFSIRTQSDTTGITLYAGAIKSDSVGNYYETRLISAWSSIEDCLIKISLIDQSDNSELDYCHVLITSYAPYYTTEEDVIEVTDYNTQYTIPVNSRGWMPNYYQYNCSISGDSCFTVTNREWTNKGEHNGKNCAFTIKTTPGSVGTGYLNIEFRGSSSSGVSWEDKEYVCSISIPIRVISYCQKNGHPYRKDQVIEPTCTTSGYSKWVCNCCGETILKDFQSPLDHNLIHVNGKAATCTASGYEAYDYCSRCSYTTKRTIAALGHDTVHHTAKAATCTEYGWAAYDTCNRCSYTTYSKIAALGHVKVHHEAQAATCTEYGWAAYDTCSRNGCDYTTYSEIPALGHEYVPHDAKAATCTEAGWAAYDTCSHEGCTYTTKIEVPALGHDPINHSGQAATCMEPGWNAYETCSRCDYTTKTVIPALGHDPIQHDGKAATCMEPGWNAYETCSRCDYTTKTVIPALGHDMSVHHEAKVPTETEEGWEAYDECSRCGYNNKVIIPPVPSADAIPLTVSSARALKGKSVTVYVSVPEDTPLYYFNAAVQYDTARLTLDSIEGAYFTDWMVNGVYAMGLASGETNVSCGANLLTLHFTVKDDAEPGDAAITLTEVEAYDVEETEVKFTVSAGKVTVRNSIPGDVTGDGLVNGLDLVRLKKFLVHIDVEIDEAASDVTGDGIVNGLDLVRLKKYLVHMPVELL